MDDQPCEWPINWPEGTFSDAERAAWGPIAAHIVWALSGRRYGRCRAWVRPLPTSMSGAWCEPRIVNGQWLNAPGNGSLLQLPRPTVAVHEVRIGDATLPAGQYRRIGDSLLRLGAAWPRQDPTAAPGTPGWWAIDLTMGYPVPLAGQAAAGLLAAELIKARRGAGKCRLPARAQSVAREGIDVQLLDPAALYTAGLTGLPEVDQWIAAVNPARLTGAPEAVSPDHPGRPALRRIQ